MLAFLIPIYQRALQGEAFSYERQSPDYAYEAHVAPLRDENGQIIGGMILSHDITERKRLEGQLRLITDNMQDMITHNDAQDRILYTSPSCHSLLGYEPEEMNGHFAHEFVSSNDWDRMLSTQQQITQQGLERGSIETRLRHADGHYVDVETVARFLYDRDGNYTGGIFVNRDITERKRFETELRAKEEDLRLITDNTQDLITYSDAQERIIYTSPSSRMLLGYEPEDMTGRFRHEFVHPEDLEQKISSRQQQIQRGKSYVVLQGRLRHADGHYVDVETTRRFLYDSDHTYIGGIYVARDITERKYFETALIESEEKYRLIAENTSDGIFVFDAVAKRVVYTSPAYDRLLGRETGETLGIAQSSFLDAVYPEDMERVFTQFKDAISNNVDYLTTTYQSQRKNGRIFWREDHTRFTYAPDGKLLRIDVISHDIPERKHMEKLLIDQQKLQTTLEKEQELSRLKTHMMERIAHEFRPPLSVIQSATESLTHYYDRLTSEKRDEKSLVVKNQIQRIIHMLDEISMVIRGTDKLAHLGRVYTDLGSMCHEITAELTATLKLPNKYIMGCKVKR